MMATALRRLTTQHAAAYVRAQPYAMRRSMVLVRAAADNKKPDNKITKGELKDIVKSATGLTLADTTRAVDALLDAIVSSVAAGKEVVVPGFGSFKPRERKARTGRNPKTGEEIKIAAKTSPAFTPGKTFRDIVAKGGK